MQAVIITPAYTHPHPLVERVVAESGLPWVTLLGHSDLPRVRSLLIEQALGSDAERVIFLDADTVPSAAALRHLATMADVTPERAVWGMYPLREGDRWSVNPVDADEADRAIGARRPFPIVTGGLGLACVHRASLERVGAGLPLITEDTGTRWRPFCVPVVHVTGETATYYADDGSLCYRLGQAATALWCDPRIVAGHVVEQVITGLRA